MIEEIQNFIENLIGFHASRPAGAGCSVWAALFYKSKLGRYVPGHIATRLAERMMRTDLSPRELEILNLLAKGLTNKEIGQILGISDNTVRNHVNSIIEKLEVSDRTEAATTAIHRGIITAGE